MFSKSWGYGIRALIRLAEIYDDPLARRQSVELAEETGMPAPFLGKVMQQLSAAKLVQSTRGRGGGIRLARDPKDITLLDVAMIVDNFDGKDVVLPGFEDAPSEVWSAIGARWAPYFRSMKEFLAETTIYELARERKSLID